jgi:hypothetical protein
MHDAASQDERMLRAQVQQARERLDALARDLRAIDDELETLSTKRHQYRLLHQACASLEELGEMGGAALFWGDRATERQREDHLRLVRSRIDVFEKQLREIEDRRHAISEELQSQQETAELLEDDLFEVQRKEEEHKLEWIIEREIDVLPDGAAIMPWSRGGEEDERFRRTLALLLLLSLLLGVLLPLVDLPLPEAWEPIEVPERLTRLIREERPLPPPPVVQEQARREEEVKPPEETPVVPEEAEPKPTSQPSPQEKVASKGILAFRERFSGLAETQAPARLGAEARIRRDGEAASGRPQRSMVTTTAPGSSGGINLAALSREVGGGGGDRIEGVQVARATSTIGGGGSDRPLSNGPGPSRTDEEIQIVFDRHKAALYRLYNRELRRDPTLQGQMVLRLRIEPDGSVSLCELQSSDMNAPQLSAQVVGRVRTFDFGAKQGIPAVTILYPIDFLPAT